MVISRSLADKLSMRPQAMVMDAPAATEQRGSERHQIILPCLVTIVEPPGQRVSGKILNLSEGGTQIRLEQPLKPSTLVQIDYDDNLLMGEVIYCRQDQSDWLAGVRIEHGLFGLTALAEAMRGF